MHTKTLFPRLIFALISGFAIIFSSQLHAVELFRNPAPDSTYIYKQINNKKLHLDVYEPENAKTPGASRPAIVFFHGGSWNTGNKNSFASKAAYIAEQSGAIAITVEYRVKSRDKTTPHAAVQDAMSAMRWVRQEAEKLGIDPNRIAAGGGSAGGQLALATALLDRQPPYNTSSISAKPDAIFLYSPVLETKNWEKMFNKKLRSISPMRQLKDPLPPTIIFQGTGDKTTPIETAINFVNRAKQKGSQNVQLRKFQGKGHGFYNDTEEQMKDVFNQTRDFMAEIGWIPDSETTLGSGTEPTSVQENQVSSESNSNDSGDPLLDNYPVPDIPPPDPIIQTLNGDELPQDPPNSSLRSIPTPSILPLIAIGLLGMIWIRSSARITRAAGNDRSASISNPSLL